MAGHSCPVPSTIFGQTLTRTCQAISADRGETTMQQGVNSTDVYADSNDGLFGHVLFGPVSKGKVTEATVGRTT